MIAADRDGAGPGSFTRLPMLAPDAARVLQFARRLADQGQGVLVVSHRITEVLSIADRATVLREGWVRVTPADEIQSQP